MPLFATVQTITTQVEARIAEDGVVTVIMDRCIKVEHARYVGRMHGSASAPAHHIYPHRPPVVGAACTVALNVSQRA
jgi:hypothetical protein